MAAKIDVAGMNFYYGAHRVLEQITVKIRPNQVTALIGPSGCGKSTFLRSLNRMNDIIPGARVEGSVRIDGQDIYAPSVDVVDLRRRVGMVFQKSNPFPKSIFENVAYGLRINRMATSREELRGRVEASLKAAALWDEVKDRLHTSALSLSGGQQQRLCIARALAVEPEILLMDEPASALDPIATQRIEELIYQLKTPIHDRHRHAQHAAGGARVRRHGVLLAGQAGRVRPDGQDLHGAVRKADRRLRHGQVRLMEPRRAASSGTFRKSSSSSRRGCSRWAGWPRNRSAWRSRGSSSATATLIDRVLVGDEPLNALHIEIDNRCFTLLALYQPMAADLRTIVAAVKINTDLERVGDLAVNIAEAARRYASHAAGQEADRHPAHGDASRRRCCATRSTRSSAATSTSPSRC